MKLLTLLLLLSSQCQQATAQPAETQIRKLLATQAEAWNNGDIPGFMGGYWQSDSLLFVGQSGITYGWQKTLDNYKKNYPDTATMGQLRFDIVTIKSIDPNNYFVLGKWFLKRTAGDVGGHFTLLLKKMKNSWKIISDHSS